MGGFKLEVLNFFNKGTKYNLIYIKKEGQYGILVNYDSKKIKEITDVNYNKFKEALENRDKLKTGGLLPGNDADNAKRKEYGETIQETLSGLFSETVGGGKKKTKRRNKKNKKKSRKIRN